MRRVIIAVVSLLVATLVIFGISYTGVLHKTAKVTPPKVDKTVRIKEVVTSEVGLILPLVGRVHANKSLQIAPEVSGRIAKIHVNTTQVVKAGDLLVELDNDHEQAVLKEAQVKLQEIERKLTTARALQKKGFVSIDALAQLEAQAKAQQAVVAAKAVELQDRYIYAPFAGILSLHHLTIGQLVHPDDILLQLDDLSAVYVDFQIPERFLSQVRVGQEVTATTDAWPGRIFIGRISHVDSHINSDTLSIKVRVFFKNPKVELLDGMMLEVALALASQTLPIVPLKAINYLGDERFVYVLGNNNEVGQRKVTLGPVRGAEVSIRAGVQAGMFVVVEGSEKIVDGDVVTVLKDDDLDVSGDVPLKKKDKKNKEDLVL